jgi:hypothetical protein
MSTVSTTPPATRRRSPGRAYFWAGVGVCLLGPALAVAQFSLKLQFVPWYSPALATLGALLLLAAVARRRGVVRVTALLLVTAVAALQWYFLVSLTKLPDYAGPARGDKLPAFRSTFADGRPFTEKDLRDGSWRVLVFFRGRG